MHPSASPPLQRPPVPYTPSGSPEIIAFKDIKGSSQRWMLPGWLPRGTCAVLEGRKGTGKSHIAAAFAAWVTGGPAPPGAGRIQPGVVFWGAGEENLKTETEPKLIAAGAKMNRMRTFSGRGKAKRSRPPKFPGDFSWLSEMIEQHKAKLVILDPIRSFVDAWIKLTDEQHTGIIMEGLGDIAEQHGCCVLCLRNLKKGRMAEALDEGIGSVAVSNISRVVLRTINGETAGDCKTLRVLATNLHTLRPDQLYKICEAGKGTRVEWGKVATSPREDDALGDLDAGQQLEASVAEDLIRRELKDGPRRSTELYAIALKESIAKTTLWRVLKKLDCKPERHGFGSDGYTEWSLPKKLRGKQSAGTEKKGEKEREKREKP